MVVKELMPRIAMLARLGLPQSQEVEKLGCLLQLDESCLSGSSSTEWKNKQFGRQQARPGLQVQVLQV